jgi:hypothetical protein
MIICKSKLKIAKKSHDNISLWRSHEYKKFASGSFCENPCQNCFVIANLTKNVW